MLRLLENKKGYNRDRKIANHLLIYFENVAGA